MLRLGLLVQQNQDIFVHEKTSLELIRLRPFQCERHTFPKISEKILLQVFIACNILISWRKGFLRRHSIIEFLGK